MIKNLSRYLIAISAFLLCFFTVFSANKYNIIPYPQQLIPQQGEFVFCSKTKVFCNSKQPEIQKLAQQFVAQLKLVSGLHPKISELSGNDTIDAIIFQDSDNQSNTEAYRLQISPKTIRIEAGSPKGFFYGLQTLYQLMPVEVYGKKKTCFKKWTAPAASIVDAPRFSYRGLHLDVCRHFFPLEFVKKYIDAMAIHKLNNFHWHLTDDQGWRIEIKKYPRLTTVGSKRNETLVGLAFGRFPQKFDGKPYGGFYTQAEAREIVKYAADRFITVIPEIEMPGHAQAAVAAYPYLSCKRDSALKVATSWGVFPDVFCPRDTTFRFLEDVLTEIMDIFPSKYIHIGGDECPKDRWKVCPDCQQLIKSKGLKDENELQSYFIHHMEAFLNSKGRKIIGWDEILDGGLAPNATVMSWRGTYGGSAAAKAGHDAIMTPGSYCYFDHYQSDPATEPLAFGGYIPLSMIYNYDPVPADLNAAEANHIIGCQANLWSEYLTTTEQVEYMAFPRVSALAEVLWSSKETKNWDSFRSRMLTQFLRYKKLNIKPSNAFYTVMFSSKINADGKLEITLSCDCPDAKILYEIEGKQFMYNQPFVLNKTTVITAKAMINGKQLGKTIPKLYQISKLTGLAYSQNPRNTWYLGGPSNPLTDGVLGNKVVYSQWLGIGSGKDAEIIVDMKDTTTVSRFSVGLLHINYLCVVFPINMKVYASVDGLDYKLLAETDLAICNSPDWEMIKPELTFTPTKVRFLKLQLRSGGSCPSDSPDYNEGSKIFMDEIGAW